MDLDRRAGSLRKMQDEVDGGARVSLHLHHPCPGCGFASDSSILRGKLPTKLVHPTGQHGNFPNGTIDTSRRLRGTSAPCPVVERGILMDMQGRTVTVTGGASGIGKATAFSLAREGARVFIGDIDEAGSRSTVAEASAEHLAIEYLSLDLTEKSSIDAFVGAVHQRVEHADGLVNGAGWDQIQPFLENPPEMWDRVIAINLMGAVRLTRGILPPMVAV